MKTIIFKTKNIIEAFVKASKIALTKSNILILEGAICKVVNSKAEIISSDLNVTLKQKVEYISCSEDFSFEIPNLKEILKTIKLFQVDEITFNSYQFDKNFQTEMILGDKKFQYNVGDANNFFHHNDVISDKIYNVNIENLKEKTDKLKKFTDTKGVKTNTIGINFRKNQIVAMKNFVLGCVQNDIAFEDEFTINENFLHKVFKVIKGDVNFIIDNYSVKFYRDNISILCKVERTTFFDYSHLFNQKYNKKIIISETKKQKLILDLKYLVSKKTIKKQPLYIQWYEDKLKTKINNEIFTVENMPICEEHISFNAEELLNILDTFDGDISINIGIKNQPLLIQNENQKFLLCIVIPKDNLFKEEE